MKKLYTLIAVAAAALTATAASTLVREIGIQVPMNAEYVQAQNLTQYAPADYPETPVPEGTWTAIGEGMVADGFLNDINSDLDVDPGTTWNVTIEQLNEDKAWYRTIVYNENSPLVDIIGEADNGYFYFNVADPTKVFSTEFLIMNGEYEVYQQCQESGLFGMLADPTSLAANPKYGVLDNGLISFPSGSFWVLDSANKRFLRINNMGGFKIALPGTVIPAMWTDLGTATWTDGLVATGFGLQDQAGNPAAFEAEIMVQESASTPYVFRLVQPWYEFTVFAEWEPSYKNLIIDESFIYEGIHVGQIEQQNIGIVDEEMGMTYIMSHSVNYNNGVLGFIADDKINWKEVNISFDEKTRELLIPGGVKSVFFYWPDTDEEHLYTMTRNLDSFITIPENGGVSNIAVENNGGAVEYYNLQGVRVENPSNGLYIKREGGKATKVIIR